MKSNNINELKDILLYDDVVLSINSNLDLLFSLIPELKYMVGFDQKHPHHHLDVWQHTLLALSFSLNDFDIRLSLLLHDIGKPFSYQDEEVRHFRNHAVVSKMMSYDILKRLDFDDDCIDKICYLIEKHDSIITDKDVKKDCELEYKRYEIQKCDALAHNPDKLDKRIKYLYKAKKMFY